MKLLSDKPFGDVLLGSTVRIPIPDVYRSKGDPPNILGIILKITDDNYYQIGTKNGKINKLYARSQFSVCEENLININEVPNNEMALRTLANLQSNGTGQCMFKCNCTTKCNFKICN